jgi:hypothetical protein
MPEDFGEIAATAAEDIKIARVRTSMTLHTASCASASRDIVAAGAASVIIGENPKVGALFPPRRAPPLVDEARANILAARKIGDNSAGFRNRRQNPSPVFLAPPTASFTARDQCHPTHAVQLASLINPT